MYRLLAIVLVVLAARAEVVDRVAISVGRQVITELGLEEEIRVTAFFNQTPLSHSSQQRRAAADRLIEQLLVAREIRLSRYPDASEIDIQSAFDRLRDLYVNQHEMAQALARYELNEGVVKEHLARQISTLNFIEYRFRPELSISEADLQSSYHQSMANWAKQHPGVPVPTFDESRASLRAALIPERTDEALDNWLKEMRKQIRVTYLEEDLRSPQAAPGQ